jgi:hypothetical protein
VATSRRLTADGAGTAGLPHLAPPWLSAAML